MLPEEGFPITVAQEEELAKEFINVVLQNYKFVKDPLILGYVNKIGQKILSVIPNQPFPYHFYVVQEDVYNAFAGPAGHIFINSGLFEAMESENELAGILAHEIAHVVSRHISQKIEKNPDRNPRRYCCRNFPRLCWRFIRSVKSSNDGIGCSQPIDFIGLQPGR